MTAKSKVGAANPAVTELERLGITAVRAERPETESQLREILNAASRQRLTLFPIGGGTALGVAALPQRVDVALDMTGLTDVVALDAKNLNMTVQAGMTIDAINERLADEGGGFFLPLDPPLSHRATIGGVYASNVFGPSRLLYGTLRDQALGVGAVDPEGRALRFGGVTVKNVSGYDLTKFFIGSAGSLCIIASISFRIYPIPAASCLCDIRLDGEPQVQGLLSELRASVLVPTAVVLTDGDSGDSLRVLVAFQGHPKAVERQQRDLIGMGNSHGGTGHTDMGRKPMIEKLRAAVDPVDTGPDGLTLKVSVPTVKGPAAYSSVRDLARELGLQAKLVLLAGNGVLFVHAWDGRDEKLAALVTGVRETARRAGGHALPLKAPREILSEWGARVDAALQRLVLKPIKEKLDPKSVLPPLG